jgi:hypothetical protein
MRAASGRRMTRYFHFAPILLGPGAVIEPGNFGRVVRLVGQTHPLYRRETAYEDFRLKQFVTRPSRLDCLFCFPTQQEAELCRAHLQGYASSVLYEVESDEADPHVADMNNALQHYGLAAFDEKLIAYYWQGWQRSPDPKAVILREVLLRSSVRVVRRVN